MIPLWCGSWGTAWGGFGWMFPLLGLLFMAVMIFVCFRMMRGCITGYGVHAPGEVEDLRAGLRELREEIRKLRERS